MSIQFSMIPRSDECEKHFPGHTLLSIDWVSEKPLATSSNKNRKSHRIHMGIAVPDGMSQRETLAFMMAMLHSWAKGLSDHPPCFDPERIDQLKVASRG